MTNSKTPSTFSKLPFLRHSIDPQVLGHNLKVLFHAKVLLSIPFGATAGILGVSSLQGIAFYFISLLATVFVALISIHLVNYITPSGSTKKNNTSIGQHRENPSFPYYFADFPKLEYLVNDFPSKEMKLAPPISTQQSISHKDRKSAPFLDLFFPGVRAYFSSANTILTFSFFGSFGTYILIWTLFFNIVHIYH